MLSNVWKLQSHTLVFQLKEYGQAGITGVHAQEPAILTQELGQCSTVATCRAVAHLVKQETVKVNVYNYEYLFAHKLSSSFKSWISVEGVWTTWDNWGACSGTCNSNTRTRSMLFNGNMPCTGTASETGNCISGLNERSICLNNNNKNIKIVLS